MKKVSVLASVVLLPALLAGAQKKSPIVEKWIASWNSHDAEQVVSICTNDILYEDVAFGAVNHGSAELRKFAVSIFAAVPDAKFDLQNSWLDGRHGTIEWVFSGTDTGLYNTGKRFTVRGITVVDLRKGRISRNLDYYDAASIMRQVGVLPPEKTDSAK